jgi:ATP-dependent Clp protease ATP-binding subunit ClpC
MYERFTTTARKVMKLACQEAMRFNHDYVGTEHILLGLVKEGSGVAANVLRTLEIEPGRVRGELEKIFQSGLDDASMGKLPQTPGARKVIEYAIEEARGFGHNYVGTEHLLLGLLREQDGVAAVVLLNLGLRLDRAREEIARVLRQDVSCGAPIAEAPPIASAGDEKIIPEAKDHPLVRQLMRMMEEYTRQKEWCVAKQQFEEAARLRDQCDRLRKDLHEIVEQLKRNPDLGMTQHDNPESP